MNVPHSLNVKADKELRSGPPTDKDLAKGVVEYKRRFRPLSRHSQLREVAAQYLGTLNWLRSEDFEDTLERVLKILYAEWGKKSGQTRRKNNLKKRQGGFQF